MLILILLFLFMLPATAAFAKGGGSTTQVDAVGPKSQELLDLENKFYGVADQFINNYTKQPQTVYSPGGSIVSRPTPTDNSLMGRLIAEAGRKTDTANARYDELGGLISSNLDKAQTAGDWWYDQAKSVYGDARGLGQTGANALSYSNEANKYYDGYAQDQLGKAAALLETGELPPALLEALQRTVNGGLDKSMGSALNDLAARGVINSSVTNRGIADMSRSAADALDAGYLDAFSTVLGGYHQGANTAATAGRSFVDTFLNINSAANDAMRNMIALGDSYGKSGSQRVADLLGVANAGMAERDQLNNHLGQYYINAAAPMMPAYDLLKQMQADHVNSNKKDTIVRQGK